MADSSNSKRILIATGIFYPDIGGPASYALALGKRLSVNHKVTVLTYSKRSKDSGDKDLLFTVVRVSRRLPKVLRHLIFYLKCRSLMAKHDTVLALNAVSAGLPAYWAAKARRKKFFVRVVGDAAWEKAMNTGKTIFLFNNFQNESKNGIIKWIHKVQTQVCKNADTIIVPSNYLAGIVKGWKIPESKIKVIYNGVDFQPVDLTREEARKQIGIAGTIILSIGRLVSWKGFRILIKAMPELLKINNFFRLVIVGDGPDNKFLRAMIRNTSLERKIFLVGQKSSKELPVYLAAADLFILNTGYEGFSHQILEAMTAAVPVITTAVGGNMEVIRQGENGFMVKYNDEFNIIEAVRTLWQNTELREHFVEEGIKTAKRFSIDKMLNETIELLNSD